VYSCHRPSVQSRGFNEYPFPRRTLASPRTIRKILYLNYHDTLSQEKSVITGRVAYQADAVPIAQRDNDPGEQIFTFVFEKRTIILGRSRAVLCISVSKRTILTCMFR
jgi:hypothetical protein